MRGKKGPIDAGRVGSSFGTSSDGELLLRLWPYPAQLMEEYPVSPRANSPANDSPDLLESVPAHEATTGTGSADQNPL